MSIFRRLFGTSVETLKTSEDVVKAMRRGQIPKLKWEEYTKTIDRTDLTIIYSLPPVALVRWIALEMDPDLKNGTYGSSHSTRLDHAVLNLTRAWDMIQRSPVSWTKEKQDQVDTALRDAANRAASLILGKAEDELDALDEWNK